VAMTHTSRAPDFARRIFDRVRESRHQQDNEPWHLLILEDLIAHRGVREGFVKLLYVLRPARAYLLDAEFEDHAEHEYMEFVRECPELEREPFESVVTADYGRFESLADLFRQIGYDERVHKEESLVWMAQPRFA